MKYTTSETWSFNLVLAAGQRPSSASWIPPLSGCQVTCPRATITRRPWQVLSVSLIGTLQLSYKSQLIVEKSLALISLLQTPSQHLPHVLIM
jgi:hypothetical protein